MTELGRVLECLLFVSGEPLSVKALTKTTQAGETEINEALRLLREGYARVGSGLQIVEIAGGFQMSTRPEYAAAVGKFLAPNANRLSRPALETVTIIAYRQPCTQAEIEAVRGVASDAVIKTLLERELIRDAGRKMTAGRPHLYETTALFLHYFGLTSLEDLPVLEEDTPEAQEERKAQTAQTDKEAREALHAAGAIGKGDRGESEQ